MPGRKTKQKTFRYYLSEIEKIHPLKSFAFLFFIISSLILSFLLFDLELKKAAIPQAFTAVHFPEILILGALMLFSTIIFTSKLHILYKEEKVTQLKSSFYLLLFVSTLFIVTQMAAVYQFRVNIEGTLPENMISYFIVLISFHLFHLILAIIFMTVLMFRLINALEDPVKTLVYITNPFEKLLLEVMQLLWNYQVIIWLVIFLYLELRY